MKGDYFKGKSFNIKLEDGRWIKCVCTEWTDEIRQFKALDGSGFIDIDWMEYSDQFSLGRIKRSDCDMNLRCGFDIENTAAKVAAFPNDPFDVAKGLAKLAVQSRISKVENMTQSQFDVLRAAGFESEEPGADNDTGFAIDGYFFGGMSFAKPDAWAAAKTELIEQLERDICFIDQINFDQFKESKAAIEIKF